MLLFKATATKLGQCQGCASLQVCLLAGLTSLVNMQLQLQFGLKSKNQTKNLNVPHVQFETFNYRADFFSNASRNAKFEKHHAP